jgi:hypothetical protein
MDEAKASWNTVYQSKEGFECQITLRDDDESSLAQRTSKVMKGITKSGGLPVKRKGFGNNNNPSSKAKTIKRPGKNKDVYVDEKGVRRCNKRLKNGAICGSPLVARQGRYGPFWGCPNYTEHAI